MVKKCFSPNSEADVKIFSIVANIQSTRCVIYQDQGKEGTLEIADM